MASAFETHLNRPLTQNLYNNSRPVNFKEALMTFKSIVKPSNTLKLPMTVLGLAIIVLMLFTAEDAISISSAHTKANMSIFESMDKVVFEKIIDNHLGIKTVKEQMLDLDKQIAELDALIEDLNTHLDEANHYLDNTQRNIDNVPNYSAHKAAQASERILNKYGSGKIDVSEVHKEGGVPYQTDIFEHARDLYNSKQSFRRSILPI